ncbi:hypothetical protein [Frankia tisae]|uniref:hypothetical protein n=1 Tax=Frankia tisae TaxID=2950104 RepID=UPI0021C09DBA|nr:hypothetical protein [Frankia tisae]
MGFGPFGAATGVGACLGGGLAFRCQHGSVIDSEVGEGLRVVAVQGVQLRGVLGAQLGQGVCVVAFEGADPGRCLGLDTVAVGLRFGGRAVGIVGAVGRLDGAVLRGFRSLGGGGRVGVGFIAGTQRGAQLVIGVPQGFASLAGLVLGGFGATGGLGGHCLDPPENGVLVERGSAAPDEGRQPPNVPGQDGKPFRESDDRGVGQPEARKQVLGGAVLAFAVGVRPAAGVLGAGPMPHALRLPGPGVTTPLTGWLAAPTDTRVL